MDNHIKIGCPRTAYELFLKLYSKKRGSACEKNNLTLLAAVKAWVALNEEEKRTFIEKFTKCKEKHRNQIALQLEKMKPYMKKKQIKRFPEVYKRPVSDENVHLPEKSSHIDEHIDNITSTNKTNCTMAEVTFIQDQGSNTNLESLLEHEVPILSEPAPPSVRNSIDLFNAIKNIKGDNNKKWTDLSKEEKMRYRKAVYELKKDYITKYRMYLENLPSKELFKYYHKIKIN